MRQQPNQQPRNHCFLADDDFAKFRIQPMNQLGFLGHLLSNLLHIRLHDDLTPQSCPRFFGYPDFLGQQYLCQGRTTPSGL